MQRTTQRGKTMTRETIEKIKKLRQRQINATRKPINRIDNYLLCLSRDDLDFYYKHHTEEIKTVVYPEEIIL
jgi:hypothetical protein